ncbi:MAG: PAS domain S-box protein [Chloroflexia bacterium]
MADDELERLFRLTVALGNTLDLEREAAAFMDWLAQAVRPALAALFIVEKGRDTLLLVGCHGLERPVEGRMPLGENPWRWLAEQGVPLPGEEAGRYLVPVSVEQELLGILALVGLPPKEATAAERLVETAVGCLAPVLRNLLRHRQVEEEVEQRTAALQREVAEHHRLLEQVRRQMEESHTLYQMGRALASTLDLPSLGRIAYEYVSRLVDCSGFGLSLYDPDTRLLRAVFVADEGKPLDVSLFPPLSMDVSPARGRARAVATGEPEIVGDLPAALAQDGKGMVFGSGEPIRLSRSALSVPMIVRGQVIGLLEVQSYRPEAYGPAEVALLQPVANQIGLALENARLFQETRRLVEFNERIVQNLADGVLLFDEEGRCTYANAAAGHILGYAAEDLVGRPWETFFPEERFRPVRSDEPDLGEGAVRLELEMSRPDGRPLTVLAGRTPYPQEGRPSGTLVVLTEITERRQAERALRQSEERYRALVEQLPAITYIVALGDSPRTIYISPQVQAFLGFSPEEWLADPQLWLRQVHPDEREQVLEAVRRRDARGEPLDLEYRILTRDGRVRWFRNRATLLRDEAGRPRYSQGLLLDVTESREAEEALRRYAALLQTLNAVIAAASAVSSLPDLLESALEQVLRALGLEMGGIWVKGVWALRGLPPDIGRACTRLMPGLSGVVAVEDWGQVPGDDPLAGMAPEMLRHGVRASLTAPILADGERLGGLSVAAAEARAWSAEERGFLEAVGRQLGNVVQRLCLLERLQEQARQMQQIMDAVPEGILLLDAGRRIVQANPLARAYLEELARFQETILSHLGGRPLEEVLEMTGGGRAYEVQVGGRTFEVVAEEVRGEGGPAGWVTLLRDVTEERESQARMEQQGRLAAMGELAAGIAHDFNNVLQGILSFAELLSGRPNLTEKDRELLLMICQLAERAAQTNRQILDFSRASVAERRPMDLAAFLDEGVRLLRRTLPETIEVLLKVEPGEYTVQANEAQLQQVLLNLATNARDAMPEGGRLEIRLSRLSLGARERPPCPEMSPGEWLCLSMADSGVGIPPEVLPHIFEPFFTTKERGRGTGLGLSQVHGIVRQHEGHIVVTSQVGRGTTVCMYLPALEERPGALPAVLPSVPVEVGSTVLLVEDDRFVREAVRAGLEHLGCRVLAAERGKEALALYERWKGEIGLLLTDMVMPDMGGLELARTLRVENPDLLVVVMTGYPLEERSREALAREALEWLQKPVDQAKLAELLRRIRSR